ncbi:MAG: N-acetylmuramoyl-L-alanine amidase [Roseobacter sp.]
MQTIQAEQNMIRLCLILATMWMLSLSTVSAQSSDNPARVFVEGSGFSQNWLGRSELQLKLSRGVPFRVFTLDAPRRLVIDFKDLIWDDVHKKDLLLESRHIADLRFGAFQPGWSRLIVDLNKALLPKDISMVVDAQTGQASLSLSLSSASGQEFAQGSGAPKSAGWPVARQDTQSTSFAPDHFVVVLDPGHGGVDPGAEREGVSEKVLMLEMAKMLRTSLQQTGQVEVVLTRDSDVFVSLQSRVAQAHQVQADLFVSLHADALSQGGAEGATVYVLSDEASDTASAHLAARHNRADIISGADLTGSDDQITSVLLDMARRETEPRTDALARSFIRHMNAVGGPMNRHPLRRAGFSVLKSADIPSVLIEVGFLSSRRDLKNLRNPAWRDGIVAAMTDAILDWRAQDAGKKALIRQ